MKTTPVSQGGTPVGHPNAKANYKDKYSSKIGSEAVSTSDGASFKDGFKAVPASGWKNRPKRPNGYRSQSRNV